MEGFESRPTASSHSPIDPDQAASVELPASDGARGLPDRDAFDRLARCTGAEATAPPSDDVWTTRPSRRTMTKARRCTSAQC